MKIFLIVVVFTSLILSACTPSPAEIIEEADIPEDIEVEPGVEEEALVVEGPSDDYATWESIGIPDEFLEYTDGDILVDSAYSDDLPLFFVQIDNSSVEAIEQYVDNALSQGYTLIWERDTQTEADLSWLINLETDEAYFGIQLDYYEEENYIIMILMKDEK
jgi:hypothetical protein